MKFLIEISGANMFLIQEVKNLIMAFARRTCQEQGINISIIRR